jgi:hypothetical protein
MLASHDIHAALATFQGPLFAQEKQPPEVRQAYAELWIQDLLGAAHPGKCEDVANKIDAFVPENKDLPFTFHGLGDIAKAPRTQFYFGLAEALCGDRKAAERRWSKVAKMKAAASSADFPFPVLAATLADPAGSQRILETALETVRSGGGPAEKGLRLYVEGMLLRAAGREGEAMAKFKEGVAESPAYPHYLNAMAQTDPPLPR